jgi:pyruvate carboxylase
VNADPDDFEANPEKYDIPDSVVGFMAGELGDLPFGWPEPFRTKVLAGRSPSISITPIDAASEVALNGTAVERRRALNELLFAQPTALFESQREQFGDVSVLDTIDFLYGLERGVEHIVDIGQGIRLFVGLEAIGAPDEKGMRTVMAVLNGQLRPMAVRDKSIAVESRTVERADTGNPQHVAAPFAGVVSMRVSPGTSVLAGEAIATIEAMKMEAAITAPHAGVVERVVFTDTQQVEGGDLIAVLSPDAETSPATLVG